jgi:hypothetical protein
VGLLGRCWPQERSREQERGAPSCVAHGATPSGDEAREAGECRGEDAGS